VGQLTCSLVRHWEGLRRWKCACRISHRMMETRMNHYQKMSTLFVDTVTKDNAVNVIGKIDDDEQKRLMGIMESLTVHKCNLSPEQATLLMNLVEEY